MMKRILPRLVLLDLLMPEMDGFQTLSEMQRIPELQNIPVVVVTSKDLSASELKWLRDRAVAVVNKGRKQPLPAGRGTRTSDRIGRFGRQSPRGRLNIGRRRAANDENPSGGRQ